MQRAALVIYDSLYGNTEKVASLIAKSLKNSRLMHLSKVKPNDVKTARLVVFGSPTQGGRATSDMQEFLERSEMDFKGIKAAVFDTRLDVRDIGFILRLIIGNLNYAAPKMAEDLEKRGAVIIKKPQGFFVGGKTGPLKNEEIKKAKNWLNNY